MKKVGLKHNSFYKIDGTMFRSQDIYQRSKRLAEKLTYILLVVMVFGIPTQHYYSNQIMLGLK